MSFHRRSSCGLLTVVCSLLILLTIALGAPASASDAMVSKKVAITQIAPHPALDSTREGVIAALKELGFTGEILFENAQGNVPLAVQIAHKFASQNPDVAVAISTPSTQALLQALPHTPIVFAAVSMPAEAGFTQEEVRHHLTGTTDSPPIEKQLGFFKSLFPHAKTVGVIYNSGETNSATFVAQLQEKSRDLGWEVREVTVSRTSEVGATVQQLVGGGVELVILPQDNTVVSAVDAIVSVTQRMGIPVVCGDTDLLAKGVFAAIGFSRFESGKEVGQLVWRILNGTSPKDIPIKSAGKLQHLVNQQVANQMKITPPQGVVFEWFKGK